MPLGSGLVRGAWPTDVLRAGARRCQQVFGLGFVRTGRLPGLPVAACPARPPHRCASVPDSHRIPWPRVWLDWPAEAIKPVVRSDCAIGHGVRREGAGVLVDPRRPAERWCDPLDIAGSGDSVRRALLSSRHRRDRCAQLMYDTPLRDRRAEAAFLLHTDPSASRSDGVSGRRSSRVLAEVASPAGIPAPLGRARQSDCGSSRARPVSADRHQLADDAGVVVGGHGCLRGVPPLKCQVDQHPQRGPAPLSPFTQVRPAWAALHRAARHPSPDGTTFGVHIHARHGTSRQPNDPFASLFDRHRSVPESSR